MPRAILAALLTIFICAVPSAAEVGTGKIAFVTPEGLFTINPDGSGLTLLKAENGGGYNGLFSARWSPDGSRLAVVDVHQQRDWRLLLLNADGSDEHLVADATKLWLSRQAWSPDGSRIAWSMDGDVYTADASGGDVRRLTHDGRASPYGPPSWSPSGSTLVYSKGTLFVIGADGQAEREVGPQGSDPTWSPSGEWIAFLGAGGVSLVRPDGSGLRAVAANGNRSPSWSPDGSRIAFGVFSVGRMTVREDAYVVDLNGSHLKRLNSDGWGFAPVWSPDGDRMLFGSFGLVTVNADGTCQMNLTSGGQRPTVPWDNGLVNIASWHGSPTGRARCHAIAATRLPVTELAQTAVIINTAVVNEGTEPVTNVTLDVRTPGGVTPAIPASLGKGCTVRNGNTRCRLSRLDPGDRHVFSVRFDARRVKPAGRAVRFQARIRAEASEELLLSGREETPVLFVLRRCTVRDRGGGSIRGTSSADRICGRRGADVIYPGRGWDVVRAGAGNDVILAADGSRYHDQISCGRGLDVAFADRQDEVSRDCERVRRPR